MCKELTQQGTRMNFSQYKTYGDIDVVMNKIFTNNPYFWGARPLYLDSSGQLNNVIKAMIAEKINVYEHTFTFTNPDENNQQEVALYNYCFGISKVRSNPLLPLVYYNAVLYMDSLGLSMHLMDNTSKIMCVQKNKYSSILNIITQQDPRLNLMHFFRHSDNFEDINGTIRCECGTVEAYRVESCLLYGGDGYIIFPFPTDREKIGRMYYFDNVI